MAYSRALTATVTVKLLAYYLGGFEVYSWITALSPLSGLGLLVLLRGEISRIMYWGGIYADRQKPQAPESLFGFTDVIVDEQTTFIETRGRTLLINPSLAVLLDPQASFISKWLRITPKISLYLFGVPGHEAIHTLGVRGEGRTFTLALYLPGTAGFALGSMIGGLLSPLVAPLLIGIIGAEALIILFNILTLRLAASQTVRLRAFNQLVRYIKRVRNTIPLRILDRLVEMVENDRDLMGWILAHPESKVIEPYLSRLIQDMYWGRAIFASLDGHRLTGRYQRKNYEMRVSLDPRDRNWVVEFWQLSAHSGRFFDNYGRPQKPIRVGKARFYYNRVAGALTIEDAYIQPGHRKEGLYTEALREIVNNLPVLTQLRHHVDGIETLQILYDALPEDAGLRVRDEDGLFPDAYTLTERWRAEIEQKSAKLTARRSKDADREEYIHRMINGRFKRILSQALSLPAEPDEESLRLYETLKAALERKLPETPPGKALRRAGLRELHLVVTKGGAMWCCTLKPALGRESYETEFPTEVPVSPWLVDWWDARLWNLAEAIEVKEPVEEKARKIELNFVTEFERTFDSMSPPRSLMLEISQGLRAGQIDEHMLNRFLERLSRFGHEEVDADLILTDWYVFLSSYSVMKEIQEDRVIPDLEAIPLLKEAQNDGLLSGPQAYWAKELVGQHDVTPEEILQWLRELNAEVALIKEKYAEFRGSIIAQAEEDRRASIHTKQVTPSRRIVLDKNRQSEITELESKTLDEIYKAIRKSVMSLLETGKYRDMVRDDPQVLLKLTGLFIPYSKSALHAIFFRLLEKKELSAKALQERGRALKNKLYELFKPFLSTRIPARERLLLMGIQEAILKALYDSQRAEGASPDDTQAEPLASNATLPRRNFLKTAAAPVAAPLLANAQIEGSRDIIERALNWPSPERTLQAPSYVGQKKVSVILEKPDIQERFDALLEELGYPIRYQAFESEIKARLSTLWVDAGLDELYRSAQSIPLAEWIEEYRSAFSHKEGHNYNILRREMTRSLFQRNKLMELAKEGLVALPDYVTQAQIDYIFLNLIGIPVKACVANQTILNLIALPDNNHLLVDLVTGENVVIENLARMGLFESPKGHLPGIEIMIADRLSEAKDKKALNKAKDILNKSDKILPLNPFAALSRVRVALGYAGIKKEKEAIELLKEVARFDTQRQILSEEVLNKFPPEISEAIERYYREHNLRAEHKDGSLPPVLASNTELARDVNINLDIGVSFTLRIMATRLKELERAGWAGREIARLLNIGLEEHIRNNSVTKDELLTLKGALILFALDSGLLDLRLSALRIDTESARRQRITANARFAAGLSRKIVYETKDRKAETEETLGRIDKIIIKRILQEAGLEEAAPHRMAESRFADYLEKELKNAGFGTRARYAAKNLVRKDNGSLLDLLMEGGVLYQKEREIIERNRGKFADLDEGEISLIRNFAARLHNDLEGYKGISGLTDTQRDAITGRLFPCKIFRGLWTQLRAANPGWNNSELIKEILQKKGAESSGVQDVTLPSNSEIGETVPAVTDSVIGSNTGIDAGNKGSSTLPFIAGLAAIMIFLTWQHGIFFLGFSTLVTGGALLALHLFVRWVERHPEQFERIKDGAERFIKKNSWVERYVDYINVSLSGAAVVFGSGILGLSLFFGPSIYILYGLGLVLIGAPYLIIRYHKDKVGGYIERIKFAYEEGGRERTDWNAVHGLAKIADPGDLKFIAEELVGPGKEELRQDAVYLVTEILVRNETTARGADRFLARLREFFDDGFLAEVTSEIPRTYDTLVRLREIPETLPRQPEDASPDDSQRDHLASNAELGKLVPASEISVSRFSLVRPLKHLGSSSLGERAFQTPLTVWDCRLLRFAYKEGSNNAEKVLKLARRYNKGELGISEDLKRAATKHNKDMEKAGWSVEWTTERPDVLVWVDKANKLVVLSTGWIVETDEDYLEHLRRRVELQKIQTKIRRAVGIKANNVKNIVIASEAKQSQTGIRSEIASEVDSVSHLAMTDDGERYGSPAPIGGGIALWSSAKAREWFGRGVALALIIPAGLAGLMLALIIRLGSPGPIFFEQERIGEEGKTIIIRKFRSMTSEPDEKDRRVTRIGAIFRTSRLDEAPQLWSIIKGDWAWFGPRALIKSEVTDEELAKIREMRRPKPGVFNSALLRRRFNEVMTTEEHLRHDAYDREHSSFNYNMELFISTATMLISGTLKMLVLQVKSVIAGWGGRDDFDSRFNKYLRKNKLLRYKALKDLFSPELKEVLLEDTDLRPVFLILLPDEYCGPLNIADQEAVEAVGGEELLLNNSAFLVGRAKLANKLAEEGHKIIVAVTDRDSEYTMHRLRRVANGRQCYILLKDGTWLGIKGAGQFRDENKPPHFWHEDKKQQDNNRHLGVADEKEAECALSVSKKLKGKAGSFIQCLGYRRVYALPDGKGNFRSAEGLKDRWGKDISTVIIFNHVLHPHKLDKLPQILRSDYGLEKLSRRISGLLAARGIIPSGTVPSGAKLMTYIMQEMGRNEAIKQNLMLFKSTIHSQDSNFAGEESDLEELFDFEAYVEDINAGIAMWHDKSSFVDLLFKHQLNVIGMCVHLSTLENLIWHSDRQGQKGVLFPKPLDNLKALFVSYFRYLDDEYLRLWTIVEPGESYPRPVIAVISDLGLEDIHPNESEILDMIFGWAKEEMERYDSLAASSGYEPHNGVNNRLGSNNNIQANLGVGLLGASHNLNDDGILWIWAAGGMIALTAASLGIVVFFGWLADRHPEQLQKIKSIFSTLKGPFGKIAAIGFTTSGFLIFVPALLFGMLDFIFYGGSLIALGLYIFRRQLLDVSVRTSLDQITDIFGEGGDSWVAVKVIHALARDARPRHMQMIIEQFMNSEHESLRQEAAVMVAYILNHHNDSPLYRNRMVMSAEAYPGFTEKVDAEMRKFSIPPKDEAEATVMAEELKAGDNIRGEIGNLSSGIRHSI